MTTRSRFVGGVMTYFDSVTHERVLPVAPNVFKDDFIGSSLVIPAAGAAESGMMWVKKIVGTGPPTVAGVANAAGGAVACTLTVTSEKQDALLYFNDNLCFDVTKGAVFEARVRMPVLPSVAAVQAVWGLASAWIDGPDNNTCFLEFGATGSGAILIRSFDGVTTVSAASGVTALATDNKTFRIDASDVTDVKYFIDGVQVSTTGQVNFAATGTLAVLQPHVQAYKASGTGVGTVQADFVRVWSNR